MLSIVARDTPSQLYERIRTTVAQAPIGTGSEATVFPLAGCDRLLLRVAKKIRTMDGTRGDLQSIVIRARTRHAAQIPQFRCVRIVYGTRYRELVAQARFGLPHLAIVDETHRLAAAREIAPEVALSPNVAVPMWVLNRCEGESIPKAFAMEDPYRALVNSDEAKQALLAYRARENAFRRKIFVEPLSAADAQSEESEAKRAFEVDGFGTSSQEHSFVGAAFSSRVDRIKAAENAVVHEREVEVARQLLEHCEAGNLRLTIGAERYAPSIEAQRSFVAAYRVFVPKYLDGVKRVAELPQATFDDAAALCRVIRDSDPRLGVDFTHAHNVVFAPIEQRLHFVDLSFTGRYPKPALEHMLWVLLGGGKRLPPSLGAKVPLQGWEALVRVGDRAMCKEHISKILRKLTIAGHRHGVPFLESEAEGGMLARLGRHFDLRHATQPSMQVDATI